MPSVLFIHGTGVRAPGYTASLDTVREGLAAVRPDVTVAGCDWGSALGSYLRADGASIPGYRPRKPVQRPAAEDEERARWALLYLDPDAELALFALIERESAGSFVPGAVSPGAKLWTRAMALAESDGVRRTWEAVGLRELLAESLRGTQASVEFRRACDAARDDLGAGSLARLTGRSLVARALAGLPGGPGSVPVPGRDAMVDAVVDALGGEARGFASGLARALGASARLMERAGGSRFVVGRRDAISERSLGFSGDILSYLVRGEAVRAYVAEMARELAPPVVLLGHSLGGIVAFDLLARGVRTDRAGDATAAGHAPGAARPDAAAVPAPPVAGPSVARLVTVGSQAPLLYELDALPSRPFGTGLPAGFPEWINIYDPRDLLSFVGSDVFGPRVRDVEVDNGQPVSAAHGAYWANRHLYEVLAEVIPR
ncbi:hypothetical protein ABT390_28085 [Streptomyces aurantiacus]|uniref:Uncharacterized protein n=1 Tax=Streptomyces aurantiacus JA 4570 TaxID=1286094 RepID=S4AIM7_9ACTN|nr:hypothetical protein [Streptomyces aurantiacus]EPH41307.1 hypothetical protein STRAU_5543 [Streptomyces aurantiacus JA 4570]